MIQIQKPFEEETFREQNAVGLDFGTTHCAVSYHDGKETIILGQTVHKGLIPCVVDYKTLQVGQEVDPFSLTKIDSIKRWLAKDPYQEIYPTGKEAVFWASLVFGYLKDYVQKHLGQQIDQAVITVPAYFDDIQRTAVQTAAQQAGWRVLRLLAEPTAAALSYGLCEKVEGVYGVYDWGGGTFDFSVLNMIDGVFQVLGTGGDNFLGGDDIDHALARHLFTGDWDQLSFLEKQKWQNEGRNLKETFLEIQKPSLTVKKIEETVLPWIEKTLEICSETLKSIGQSFADLKGLILVGGSTKMPYVFQTLQKSLCCPIYQSHYPEHVVALGAGIQAYQLTHQLSYLLLDAVPLSLGVETWGGVVERIIPRNAPLPSKGSVTFTTAEHGQTKMKIRVVQGENEFAQQCRCLGEFELSGITPLPKGQVHIQIDFTLDVNGLLTVQAFQKGHEETVKYNLKVSSHKDLTAGEVQERVKAYQESDGQEVIARLQLQKIQQVQDMLDELQRFLRTTPEIFLCQERKEVEILCQNMKDFLDQQEGLSFQELDQSWQHFSDCVLPWVEKYLTALLSKSD
ncbi:MAG: hypothetical protein BGO07_03995 [Alphaproteobacteria bacterium 40-19]|nr:MAG: hypothetical protein BGO07_03995 [Alphaproteobacteria bacterium 40-19]